MMSTTSSSPSAAATAEDTLQTLAQNLIDQRKSKLVIAVAGGGGHAISSLAATPGASAVLYGTVTYDRNSFRNYVRSKPEAVNALTSTDFKFASLEAAKLLSEVSLQRALTYAAVQDNNILTYTSNQHIGIGCASALVSNKSSAINNNSINNIDNSDSKNSNKGTNSSTKLGYIYSRKGKSRAFVVATRADGRQWFGNLTLTEGRSRMEEDLIVSHFLLQAASQVNNNVNTYDETDSQLSTFKIPNMMPGDEIQDWYSHKTSLSTQPNHEVVDVDCDNDEVITAAQRIVQGEAQVILLVPTATTSSKGPGYSYRAVQYPVLPHASLIFPGSYNPPHVGHAELAKAALEEVINNKSNYTTNTSPAVFMEMSLTNPDKPSMDPLVVSQRAHQFFQLMEQMPQNWGLLLTRAPLFAQKVELLQSLIAPPSPENSALLNNNRNNSNNSNNATKSDGDGATASADHNLFFILGTDTMVRILNPKYYGNDFETMVRAVRGMKRHQVHFIAGGRLEQSSAPTSSRFVTGETELGGLPPDIQEMFTLLPDFRIDISSTVIRQQQLQKQQQQQQQQQNAAVSPMGGGGT